MEYLLIKLLDEKEGLAIPTSRVVGIEEAKEVHRIPFAYEKLSKVVTFRDKLYAIPEKFEKGKNNIFIFLDNHIAIPISGVIARVETDFLTIKKEYAVFKREKFRILEPEKILPDEEDTIR